jgi:predicted metalloprotease with PDZ domain
MMIDTSNGDDVILYDIDLGSHRQHLVHVRVEVPADLASGARVVLPVWTPGSYVVRDYARHVQRIDAHDGEGRPIDLSRDGRTAWKLPDDVVGPVWVRLELYANELTVRTNHVDDHHALLIPAATLPYVEGAEARSHHVRIDVPDGWASWSLLPEVEGAYVADDYDHLVDSAFEAGNHEVVEFEVRGVPHRFVWAGHAGRPDLDRIAADAAAIGEAAVDLVGELPVDRYTYLCTAWDQGGGGLEHRDGSVVQFPAHELRDPVGYDRFLTLLAHEYFHLWNVKRLAPADLIDLDYERPVHTTSLWMAEGWTAYYDELLPMRAGVRERKRFLGRLGEQVTNVLERPGRHIQSVHDASWEAWTKFYVRDENHPNVGVSYYEHGTVLAWCLDLLVRGAQPSSAGLDDVFRLLWERFAETRDGYTEADVVSAASEVAGTDLASFFSDHVEGLDEPPILGLLTTVGLRMKDENNDDDPPVPDLGVVTSEDDEGVVLESVLRGRPAWDAGLTGGDRLLAIDGVRVRRGELRKALRPFSAGDEITVSVFRGPRLVTEVVQLGKPRPSRKLAPVDEPTDDQRESFLTWAGCPLAGEDGD